MVHAEDAFLNETGCSVKPTISYNRENIRSMYSTDMATNLTIFRKDLAPLANPEK